MSKMKAAFRERFAKQYGSKRLRNENTFAVKYLGSVAKLAKDKKVVENAVNHLTDRALKEISYKPLGKHLIHVTEKRVALFPKGKLKEGSEIFSISIEKMSYGFFPPKRGYQILALNRHVSKSEVETYVVCCKSKDKMFSIKVAFYSTFKGRYLARLRKKRLESISLASQDPNQRYSRQEGAENPRTIVQNGTARPPVLSNKAISECPKDKTVVDIHQREQRREEAARTQNNIAIVTVRPTHKIASGVNKNQSLKVDRILKSTMC